MSALQITPQFLSKIDKDVSTDLALERCAERIHQCTGRVLADCFEIGAQLSKARDTLRGAYTEGDAEGKWRKWLRDDVQMSHMHAQRFIWVWDKYNRGNPGVPPVVSAAFSVLAELAMPNADQVAVEAIEQYIAQGGTLTKRQAAALKNDRSIHTADDVRAALEKKKRRKPTSARHNTPAAKALAVRVHLHYVCEAIGKDLKLFVSGIPTDDREHIASVLQQLIAALKKK